MLLSSPSQAWPYTPLTLSTVQILLSLWGIGFTDSSPIFRQSLLPLIGLSAWLSILSCAEHMPRGWGALLDGLNSMWLAQYISVTFPSQYNIIYAPERDIIASSHANGRQSGVKKGVWNGLKFAAHTLFSLREARPMKSTALKEPKPVLSRAGFLLRTSCSLILCCLVVDLFSVASSTVPDAALFSPEAIPVFRNLGSVSVQALLFRVASTLGFWFCARLVNQVRVDIVALVTVALGFWDADSWSPLFGSISEAYTIRRFWGVFYHQLFRRFCSRIADFIAYSAMRLPRNTLISRYAILFITFLLSGIIHVSGDMGAGLPLRESGSLYFFCTQAAGIMLEDAVQGGYQSLSGRSEGNRRKGPSRWARLLGWTWVILFLSWSTPMWVFPVMHFNVTMSRHDSILPFSPIAGVMKALS